MRAARLSLGMCGVITRVTMPVTPQFHLRRRRWRVNGAAAFLDGGEMGALKQKYDRFHYYIHPVTGGFGVFAGLMGQARVRALQVHACSLAPRARLRRLRSAPRLD